MNEQDDYNNILKQIKNIQKQLEIIEKFIKNCIIINKHFIENNIKLLYIMPYHTKEKKTIKKKVVKKTKKISNGLTEKQNEKLKEHKKHHTAKHMTIMKRMMKKGASFTKAHNIAKKMVGK